ncbi:MAG: pyridoxamine 5'-phosphate oxidase family protein [Dehalococcoidia bacterium]
MTSLKTGRSTVRRAPQRARYDRESLYEVLDAGFVCHVGIVDGAAPVVIPTLYGRLGDELVIHGATTSRLMRAVAAGATICIAVTHVDGLVLARSLFHHSMNYRSAVVFGTGREIEDAGEKRRALDAISDQLLPGRGEDARGPSDGELRATKVVAIRIEEASLKQRTGPPVDDEADHALPVWAGVLPLTAEWGEPEPDPQGGSDRGLPAYLQDPPPPGRTR